MTPAKAPAAEEEEQHAEAEEEGDEMYGEDMYARHDPPPVVPADQLPPGTPAPPAALEPEDSDDDDGLNVVMDDSDAGARRTYTRALGRSTRPVGSLSRERERGAALLVASQSRSCPRRTQQSVSARPLTRASPVGGAERSSAASVASERERR